MDRERQRVEGVLLSLPTANVCSRMTTGERDWLMVYIKIESPPLLEQKKA